MTINTVAVLCWAVAAMVLAAPGARGQIVPSAELQHTMLVEQDSFLARMKPGLQHMQMRAVRAAMRGDDTALERTRESRNQPPVLPQGVEAVYVRPDLCLFMPSKPSARKRPLLLYLHGGGWCFGSINSCARFCAALALEGDCCVAALNYRLAPAHRFPAPLHDCQQALAYLKQHAAQWGCDSSLVSVGGDSAGGNLALATAMTVPGVCKVIPIYPVTKLYTVPSAWHATRWHRWDWPATRRCRPCRRCSSSRPGTTSSLTRRPNWPAASSGCITRSAIMCIPRPPTCLSLCRVSRRPSTRLWQRWPAS